MTRACVTLRIATHGETCWRASALWSSTILFIVSVYVAPQVATWASDDAEGRLEMLLAASVSRSRAVLERLGALAVATSAIVAAAAIAAALALLRRRQVAT